MQSLFAPSTYTTPVKPMAPGMGGPGTGGPGLGQGGGWGQGFNILQQQQQNPFAGHFGSAMNGFPNPNEVSPMPPGSPVPPGAQSFGGGHSQSMPPQGYAQPMLQQGQPMRHAFGGGGGRGLFGGGFQRGGMSGFGPGAPTMGPQIQPFRGL